MDNPGPFQFQLSGAAFTPLTSAGTLIGDAMTGFAGIESLSLQAQFQYGSGGGNTLDAYIQTSLDQGQTWFDIANFHFTTSNGLAVANLSGLTPVTAIYTPVSLALSANTVKDGLLGDRFRAGVVIAGAYLGIPLLNLTGVAR